MKITTKQKLITVLLLTIVHNILFWNELLGINVLIYSSVLIGTLFLFNRPSFKILNVRITLAGTFISALFVVLYGSDVAKFSHFASLFILIGFIHAPMLRSIVFSIGELLETLIRLPSSLKKPKEEGRASHNYAPLYRKLRLSLVPMVALFIFYWIYKLANPVFDELSSHFWNTIGDSIADVFKNFSFDRIFFGMIGLLIAVIALFQPAIQSVLESELRLFDRLFRTKKRYGKKKASLHYFKTLSLLDEYQSALIMVGLINLLLLIVNGIDINWIWFNFDVKSVSNLSQFVHEGTYLLIASILLSMGIIEYFFRKNLNFYSKNTKLKNLCYLWIAQNIVMVVSVAMRNYHYIAQHGLAYKRIGVIFFLILTIAGLISQAYKINQTRSGYFMLRVNSWAVYAVMLLISSIDWDIVIARHNISHPMSENIDTKFLLSLAPKTLPVLLQNQELFNRDTLQYTEFVRPAQTEPISQEEEAGFKEDELREQAYTIEQNRKNSLQYKCRVFMSNYEKRNRLEWNYADASAYEELKKSMGKTNNL